MGDMPADPPIVEQDYLSGVKVVDIGDLRVARGMSRRPIALCRHRALMYDQNERRIWCKDCESDVAAFDAFLVIVENFDGAADTIRREMERVNQAVSHNLISIASKQMDEKFRRKKMVPACPHCGEGIFPEDVAKMGSINREWETVRRARKAKDSTHDPR